MNRTSVLFYAFGFNTRVPKDAEVGLIWIDEKAVTDSTMTDEFQSETDRLAIAICYCSVDSRCAWAGYNLIENLVGKLPRCQ